MNPKHTEGPWSLTYENRPTIFRGGQTPRTLPIAKVYSGDIKQSLADARLIAAAPELLTALRNLLEDAIALGIEDSDRSGSAIEARAILAKAEGSHLTS